MSSRMHCAGMLGAIVLSVGTAYGDTITQWNFNSVPPDGNTSTGTLIPNIGLGTASFVGGTTGTFASGVVEGGSSDPAAEDNSAWNITTWAPQGQGSGTRGVQFAGSTAGFQDIVVSWDNRASNTMARHVQFQYTLDGTTFTTAGLGPQNQGVFEATAGMMWFNGRTIDLSGIAGVNDNPNFAFRIVAIFDPSTGQYTASQPGSNYGTTGTLRFDMVTIAGTRIPVIPLPATAGLALAGLGFVIGARARR